MPPMPVVACGFPRFQPTGGCVLVTGLLLSASVALQAAAPEAPTRYDAAGGAVVGGNLPDFNNRPLYCANTNVFILAGDRPLARFARSDRHYGTFLLGVIRGDGTTLWLHEADDVRTAYRAGHFTWTVRDSRLRGLTLTWQVQPAGSGLGLVGRLEAEGARANDRLVWAFGGASGKVKGSLSNQLDALTVPAVRSLGFDPASCAGNRVEVGPDGFLLQADASAPAIRGRCSDGEGLRVGDADRAGTPASLVASAHGSAQPQARPIAVGDADLTGAREFLWLVEVHDSPDGGRRVDGSSLAASHAKASARTAALAARVQVDTPDARLNAAAAAAAAAIDGVWYPPVFVHGGMMWNQRFPGWRTVYGGTVYGWHERVRAQAEHYLATQETKDLKRSFRADPASLLTEAAPDSRFYGRGRILKDQKFYNMQSQFFEQLIHAWRWTGDAALAARLRPALELHLEWQRQCFDPDGDGCYESYINTWPTDSIWFNGGGTPDETAYAYSGHHAARDLARLAGDADAAARHERMLAHIKAGFFRHLWNPERGHPGLYREQGGHRRLHDDAWLYSIFLPVGSGLLDAEQMLSSLRYTEWGLQNDRLPIGGRRVWTSNFVPGIWSVRELWAGDNYHLALAYFQAGLGDDGWDILRGNFLHGAYNQPSPGNLGSPQGGTDFGDCVHPFARVLVEGLFGFAPDYPNGLIRLTPQFPAHWDHASIRTPDFQLDHRREGSLARWRFVLAHPAPTRLTVPVRAHRVRSVTVNGTPFSGRTEPGYGCTRLVLDLPALAQAAVEIQTEGETPATSTVAAADYPPGGTRVYLTSRRTETIGNLPRWSVRQDPVAGATDFERSRSSAVRTIAATARWLPIDLAAQCNADLRAIFRQEYLTPRPATISVRLGSDGYSPWTFWHWKSRPPLIGFERVSPLLDPADQTRLRTPAGVPFAWNGKERNIAFTSLWDNYPRAVTVPVGRAAEAVFFLVAGSTNPMQGRIPNAVLRLGYDDGVEERLELIPPYNYWNLCPIRAGATAAGQESRAYYDAEADAFAVPKPWPDLVTLGENCHAVLLSRGLRPHRVLREVTLETLSPEVVVGLLGLTLMNPAR